MGEETIEMRDETPMGSNRDSGAQDSVVLASYQSRRGAEHMLASLGRGFRKQARKGAVDAFVISGNQDGSLKVTESRVVSASAVVAALMRVVLAMGVGFTGLFSSVKGGTAVGHAGHARKSHVASDDRVHALLALGGAKGTIAMVVCKDRKTRQLVTEHASDRAGASWDGSRSEFLAALDPGSKHDWVRSTLGERSANR